jgi:hypothetical protein
MFPEIITYDHARRIGLPLFFSGRPCAHGHIAQRRTMTGRCVVCYPIKTVMSAEDQLRRREKCEAEAQRRAHLYEGVAIKRVKEISGWQERMMDTPDAKVRNRYLNRVLAERTTARLNELRQASKEMV